jgi:tRNA-splicing ligase RtcB (3'-phosphate/5'-hydroxy nucleic acid ligase)
MNNYPVSLPGAKAPTLMWAWEHEIEPQAVQQIRRVGDLPWVYGLRIMPDFHLGAGATIGTVIASESVIVPSAVGVDIGCGVNAVKTNLKREDIEDDLPKLRSLIEAAVPVGFNMHERSVASHDLPGHGWHDFWSRFRDLHSGVQRNESKAMKQMGTLGGGNHFIELCTDSQGFVWITLHSGSRNVGKELAERHIEIAKKLPENQDLPDKELAVLFLNTPQAEAYSHDLKWAQEYAMRSRSVMMALVRNVLRSKYQSRVQFEDEINCHHNYVAHEEIDGKDMVVTRKGAISAHKGQLALIPGSMATGSYIVRGLGNPDSYFSASHGAGRKMSRSAAKRQFTVEDVERSMAGIEARKDAGVIDEIEYAYKSIHDVIDAQTDLVEAVEHLQTILCVKG